jgi:hypothetical protein
MAKKTLIEQLTDAFIKSELIDEDGQSEKIELDNLDWARLMFKDGSEEEIEVENEHGTHFPITDLSKTEIEIFLTVL